MNDPSGTLLAAALVGDVEAMRAALAQGADPDAHMPVGDEGGFWTALVHAISSRSEAAVALLLASGANPNLTGMRTPLAWAARLGQEAICRRLLAAGALVARDADDDRMIHEAFRSRNMRVVRLLIDAGAPMLKNAYLRRQLAERARGDGDHHLARVVESEP